MTHSSTDTGFELINAWWQHFPTVDGIHARHSSLPASEGQERSRVRVSHQADPQLVVIEEVFSGGSRQMLAEKNTVLPMMDALETGRMPYRFVAIDSAPEVELAAAMQIPQFIGGDPSWGPSLIHLDDGICRRLRAVYDGATAFVIMEDSDHAPVVFGGPKQEFTQVGLMRYYEALDRLT